MAVHVRAKNAEIFLVRRDEPNNFFYTYKTV